MTYPHSDNGSSHLTITQNSESLPTAPNVLTVNIPITPLTTFIQELFVSPPPKPPVVSMTQRIIITIQKVAINVMPFLHKLITIPMVIGPVAMQSIYLQITNQIMITPLVLLTDLHSVRQYPIYVMDALVSNQ